MDSRSRSSRPRRRAGRPGLPSPPRPTRPSVRGYSRFRRRTTPRIIHPSPSHRRFRAKQRRRTRGELDVTLSFPPVRDPPRDRLSRRGSFVEIWTHAMVGRGECGGMNVRLNCVEGEGRRERRRAQSDRGSRRAGGGLNGEETVKSCPPRNGQKCCWGTHTLCSRSGLL